MDKLVDDSLFEVLKRIPLPKLLEFKCVCRQWKRVADLVCRSKRKLTIVSDDVKSFEVFKKMNYELDELNCLQIYISHYKSISIRPELAELFPNVTHLEYVRNYLYVDQLVPLLRTWKNLKILKVAIENRKCKSKSAEWNRLLQQLTSSTSLRTLSVKCGYEGRADYNPDGDRTDRTACLLPDLHQLQNFTFDLPLSDYDKASEVVNNWPNLKRFAMLHFGLYYIHDGEMIYIPQFQLKPSKNLTHFNLAYYKSRIELIQYNRVNNFLFLSFPNLTHLELMSVLPLGTLFTCYGLHRLNQLVNIRVVNSVCHDQFTPAHEICQIPSAPPAHEVICFKSLKRIELENIPHRPFGDWAGKMPSLKVIKLNKRYGCYPCEDCLQKQNYFQCEKSFVQSLLLIDSLEKLYFASPMHTTPNEWLKKNGLLSEKFTFNQIPNYKLDCNLCVIMIRHFANQKNTN